MGRFAEQAEILLRRRVDNGETVAEARRSIQTKCQRSIWEREDSITERKFRFNGTPPADIQKQIENDEAYIRTEREWMREFDNFKDDHFG